MDWTSTLIVLCRSVQGLQASWAEVASVEPQQVSLSLALSHPVLPARSPSSIMVKSNP